MTIGSKKEMENRMTDRESEMAREAERILYEYDNETDIDNEEFKRFSGMYRERNEFEDERMGTNRQDRGSNE